MYERTPPGAEGRIVPITFALGLGTFLTLFDVTAVVVAMPGIAKDLGFAVAGAAWVIDAYSLAFTGALLASGALADRFGRRRSMLTGNAVFLVASIACGLATDGPMLLASRVVQGVGAAFMVTGAIALVAGAFPNLAERARAFGMIGVLSGVAMALGPTLGGLLASWFGWRWIFYANIPFCLSLTLLVPRVVAETNDPDGPPLDPVGVALLTISLGLAIDALLRRDGSLAIRAACLAGSAMAAFLFVLQQWHSSRPVLDPRVFATSAMAGVGALLTAIQFGYWAVLVYLPLFLSAGLLVSMEVAGAALLAATLPMLLVPLIGGCFVTQWGWRRFFVVAFGIIAVGDALLALAAVSTNPAMRLAATITGMLTIGVGSALANPQMSSVVLALAPPTQTGMASAVTMIVRQAGFAISIAALGATLTRTDMTTAFAAPFALATLAALAAIVAAVILLPAKSSQKDVAS
ncbi:MFS family permease [Bradyrhizobium sp. AZCC 1678]|uniref:MFS transporter n=1 Tax=Bradyrhizobium sp. AZCC 1678 TaxID=3117030 RepID=UPI002FF2F74D